jgi:c(7)-type cytochrome triheme protein
MAASSAPGARGPWIVLLLALLAIPLSALAIPATLRIPRAREARPFAPAARALFSHAGHEPLRCFQCHPGLFPQSQRAFTHADMDRGRACGGCHDGRRAPAAAAYTCESCHVPHR